MTETSNDPRRRNSRICLKENQADLIFDELQVPLKELSVS